MIAALTAVALGVAPGATAWAAPPPAPDRVSAQTGTGPSPDTRHVQADDLVLTDDQGRAVPPRELGAELAASREGHLRAQALDGPPEVGTVRSWVTVDFVTGRAYLKEFVLRGVGEHIEVWTATGTQASPGQPETTDVGFLPGDCRNDSRTAITDDQVDYLVEEFETTIYPAESEAFSRPTDRDGSGQLLGEEFDFSGEGDNIVALVDNVRDENFYDVDNSQSLTYVAGFFSRGISEAVDRNVMTIDAFDWLHRTGAVPPDEPSGDPCTNAPARPYLYESVFAHEYQHLLESYEDPDETSWVNEGLSDYAQSVTGYATPRGSVFQPRYESHIQCFLGYLAVRTPYNTIPRDQCGPSNSLTLWGDQGQDNILADYGAAWTFMEYLRDRFGEDFLSQLHRADGNGLEGLQDVLDVFSPGTDVMDVLHDWAAMIALDQVLDRGGRLLADRDAVDFRSPSLRSSVMWSSPEAYLSGDEAVAGEGVPPNGSDYVRLRDERGLAVSSRDLESLTFEGSPTVASREVEWTVDPAPEGHDSAALYSGTDDNLDRSIAREVEVPADDAVLSIETRWDTEPAFDSGFVQVSTDEGRTWTSLGNEDTTVTLDPGADRLLVDNLPGLNGQGGWTTSTFDLSEYAGETVWLGLRYVSDENTNGLGWWVDDVTVGDVVVSDGSSLGGWQTYDQLTPDSVEGYAVQLIAYDDRVRSAPVAYAQLELDSDFRGTLDVGRFLQGVRRDLRYVAAVVTQDDRSETVSQYAPYRLVVNGVEQPGGGWDSDGGQDDDTDDDPRV